jgi:hypothetical protein
MPINFRISALVPVGLIVESVAHFEDAILVTARAGSQVVWIAFAPRSQPVCS